MVEPNHRGRAFGIYGMTIGFTALPASILAGFLWDRFGAQVPFYFGGVMACLALLLLFIFSKKLSQSRGV
jgi:MFS family permease